MDQLDITLKHAISEFPEDWARFLGVRPGVPVQVVDADLSTIAAVADKALLVLDDPQFVLHIEPHGWYDVGLDGRVLGYNALLGRRFGVFVHTAVVLLDRRAWGPANTGRVTGRSPLGNCEIDFRYEVIKVWELPVDRILAAGVGVLPLAPIADVPKSDLPQVVERMAERFDAELPRTEAAEMWTATFVLVGLKYDREFAQILLKGVRETMRESTTYQAILEEGKAEGRVEGQAEAKQDVLLKLGTKCLGEPDPDTVARIHSLQDLDRLDALVLRLVDVEGWDELLGGDSPARL